MNKVNELLRKHLLPPDADFPYFEYMGPWPEDIEVKCEACGKLTTSLEAASRELNAGKCAHCGGKLFVTKGE